MKKAVVVAQPTRTLRPIKGRPIGNVVEVVRRPAVLVCKLANGKKVEVLEESIATIDPPFTEPVPTE